MKQGFAAGSASLIESRVGWQVGICSGSGGQLGPDRAAIGSREMNEAMRYDESRDTEGKEGVMRGDVEDGMTSRKRRVT